MSSFAGANKAKRKRRSLEVVAERSRGGHISAMSPERTPAKRQYLRAKFPRMLRLLLLLGWIWTGTTAFAQLNTRIGYTLGAYDLDRYNAIIDRYNASIPWLDELPRVRTVSGITAGLRYRWEPVGLELSWRNQFTNRRVENVDPATNQNFRRRLANRINTYSAGIELNAGPVAVGGAIDYHTVGIRTETTGRDEVVELIDRQNSWGHTLHLSWEPELGNERLSIALRPYWQVFWEDINILGVGTEFEPDRAATVPSSDYRADFGHFGLMVIFYNGEKE